ncbi:exodeoxyribonuclease V subunit beta [Methylomicrobium lacus]|uniref:exodeoxyribonuclease V subunit beta n=1 Tax=Methylomicrobium lacus TaxID=136992 RepID=UPI0035A987DF
MTAAIALNAVDFPLAGTRLIEASAGTGKTYTIAALYVRLVLGHHLALERDLFPPDILVVTFTEAATKELRDRIRGRLSQAARYFREQTDDSDPFLQAVRTHYDRAAWPACARRLELAANWMDEAAVYTIHGWCNRMLQQHAFDSGSLFRQEVNTADLELLHEVVRDYWRSFFYPLTETACRVVAKLARSPEDLIKLLSPLLSETEAFGLEFEGDIKAVFQAWEDWENERQDLEAKARDQWSLQRTEIGRLLNEASNNGWLNGTKYRKASFAEKLNEMADWASRRNPKTIDVLEKFGQESLESALVKAHQDKAAHLQHPAFAAIDALARHTREEIDTNGKITLHALHWIRNRYDGEKQRIARMTFDDMLTRLDQALQGGNGPRLASAIRQQYPIALIDEFQDTDPVQYRIFSALYPQDSDSGSGCFMIGDPKQAIYSFRGADIYTYLKAHQHTLGRHYTLGTNFRSTMALVDAINQVFLQADRHPEGAFRFKREKDDPLPFLPVAAKGRDEEWLIQGQTAPALTFWHWDADEAVGMPAYRENMAEVAASEIVRLLNAAKSGQTGFKSAKGLEPLQPSDIAILVRSGTEARAMRNALAKRQLRSVYLSERDSIFTTREAADLLIWLRALAEPRNERRVRAALSSATFGWTYQALQQLALDEPLWEQQLERFAAYQQRWQQDGILPALRQLINDYDLYHRSTQDSEGERRITNLLHLAELLQHAGHQLEGEQALIRHLAELIKAGGSHAGDEGIIRLESDANLIKIITIHKSKGLEYPLVFLPFICSFREVNGRFSTFYRYHDDQQNLHIDLNKSDTIKALSDAERLQEDLRLLYVAITRARHACWLGIAPIKSGNGKECQLEKSAVGSILGWEAKMPAKDLKQQLTELKGDCASIAISALPDARSDLYFPPPQSDSPGSARTASAKIPNDWWIASYSALPTEDKLQAGEDQPNLPQEQEPETARDDKQSDEAEISLAQSATSPTGIHALPRGAGPGVLIHDLLEHCAHLGFSAVRADPALRKELIQKRFGASDWINHQDSIDSALSRWLSLPLLETTDICLGNLSPGAYRPELEFLIGADAVKTQELDRLVTQHIFPGQPRPALLPKQVNGLLKGFIDLVFEHDQRYYVVDYKFNSLGGNDAAYTQEALTAAMLAKRYDLQYALYLLALHRLLKARLGENYAYDTHIGGSLYLFLRGSQSPTGGRLFDKPPRALIEGMDKLFYGGDTR